MLLLYQPGAEQMQSFVHPSLMPVGGQSCFMPRAQKNLHFGSKARVTGLAVGGKGLMSHVYVMWFFELCLME